MTGTCQCGCGGTTQPYTRTTAALGKVKGQPARFLPGHKPQRPADERFWEKVRKEEGAGACWLWTATKTQNGYGLFTTDGRTGPAHRFAYELLVGPIPDGMQLDHLCRVRECVNPDHLEPVTNDENIRRGMKGELRTHCRNGHAYLPDNLILEPVGDGRTARRCKVCREAQRARASRRSLIFAGSATETAA